MEHLNDIMAFEAGDMSEDEMLDFFQRIVNDGTVWRLQGFYVRTAVQLLEAGAIEPPEVIG